LETQSLRVLSYIRNKDISPLEKYIYLNRIKRESANLFYFVTLGNIKEVAPLIYTPTVGAACQNFSHIYTPGFTDGLFIGLNDQGKIHEILENWPYQSPDGSNGPDICVITDGSRILGLGDQGINGMPIPIGKLSLYIACSGFNPSRTLPITLDMGTNRQEYLDDPLYLGSKTPRPPQRRVLEFMDVLMAEMHKRWPKMVIQFEDFSTENCFTILDRYRDRYRCFNDDIQVNYLMMKSYIFNNDLISKPLLTLY
jgi:malate dehydrogenase (oxaloacetate-decarboxylating)(NADP+)